MISGKVAIVSYVKQDGWQIMNNGILSRKGGYAQDSQRLGVYAGQYK